MDAVSHRTGWAVLRAISAGHQDNLVQSSELTHRVTVCVLCYSRVLGNQRKCSGSWMVWWWCIPVL